MSTTNTPVLDKDVTDDPDNDTQRSAGKTEDRGRRAATPAAKGKTLAVSVRTLVVSAVIVALVAGLGILGWQLQTTSSDLDAMRTTAANGTHAEQVALDYATGAADMDFKDLGSWRARLTKGTSPELSNRLTQASTSMEQIITPLQWVAKSTPIVAKVRSESNGIYVVDCFVSVHTTNGQAPDGIQSTATYQLTIDSGHDWVITEIGGIESSLGAPTPPR